MQSFFAVFKYVICEGFRESSMRDALEKVAGGPDSNTLIARSYLSTVVHNQLVERADANRSHRKGSIYVEARREKATALFLNLREGRQRYDTVPSDSVLAGFGMFSVQSGHGKRLTICLAAGWCGGCPMHSETCKHLMAFRMLWISLHQRAVWADRELDTVLPRKMFEYPLRGVELPHTCLPTRLFRVTPITAPGTQAGGVADALAATGSNAQSAIGINDFYSELRTASAFSNCAVAPPGQEPSDAARHIVHRLVGLHRSRAAQLRRLRKLISGATCGDIEALLGGELLELAVDCDDRFSSAMRELESTAISSAALIPASTSTAATHALNRLLFRHSVTFARKGDHPAHEIKQSRRAMRVEATQDSPEPSASRVAVIARGVGHAASGLHRHRPSKHITLPKAPKRQRRSETVSMWSMIPETNGSRNQRLNSRYYLFIPRMQTRSDMTASAGEAAQEREPSQELLGVAEGTNPT
jgi:hypothetical protein